jgi:hypothetical protein
MSWTPGEGTPLSHLITTDVKKDTMATLLLSPKGIYNGIA